MGEVTCVWCIVIQDVATEEIFQYGPEQIKEGLAKLDTFDRIIGHNIIRYDLPVLKSLHQFVPKARVLDTLILSRLSNPDRGMPWGMKGKRIPHAIEAWAIRLGGQKKIEHNDWERFSAEMMERCRVDVLINLEVYKALFKEFSE